MCRANPDLCPFETENWHTSYSHPGERSYQVCFFLSWEPVPDRRMDDDNAAY